MRQKQLVLGQIIGRLDAIKNKDEKRVWFDFENAYPTDLMSWRGVYAELALGFEFDEDAPTVAKLINELRGAIGKKYEGYKGGCFRMDEQTRVWVANWGNVGNTVIVNVLEDAWLVILETQFKGNE